jgi:hypothetical protein
MIERLEKQKGMDYLYLIPRTSFHDLNNPSYIPSEITSLLAFLSLFSLTQHNYAFTLKIIFANIHSASSISTFIPSKSKAFLNVEMGILVLDPSTK